MGKKAKYSWKLNDWVVGKIPQQIRAAMSQNGWNAFGVYEVVKEGIAWERKKQERMKAKKEEINAARARL